MATRLKYFADGAVPSWKRLGFADGTVPAASWVRKSGTGYVRYEDLHVTGDTIQQTLNRLTTDAVVTFPPGLFQFTDFAVSTYYGIVFSNHILGISGSGMTGANATIFEMVTGSSTKGGYAASLTTSDVNLLHLMTTASGLNNVELSGFHLRGTEQSHWYNGIHMQKNQKYLIDNVLISGIPGAAPTPPTETFALNILGAGGDAGVVQNSQIDGRRYDSNNTPGSRVSSSLLGVNALGSQDTVSPAPLLLIKSTLISNGLYGPVALWHTFDTEFDDCTLGGRINQEETGRILYQRLNMIDPFGNGAVGQHFQQFNSTGDTTMLSPTWVVGLSGAAGKIATHQTNSTANPLIAHNESGTPLQIYMQDEAGFSVVTSR